MAPGQGGEGNTILSGATFTVPVPPSVNQLFRNVAGKGRVKTQVYDNYRAHAVTSIKLQKVPQVEGNVVMLLGVERKSLSSDLDNRLKAMVDAIVEAGVIEDDRFVTAYAVAWAPQANGLAHVNVLPVQRLNFEFYPSNDGATGGFFLAPQQQGAEDGYSAF